MIAHQSTATEFDFPPLPAHAVTRDGVRFDAGKDIWYISSVQHRRSKFDFSQLPKLGLKIKYSLQLAVLDIIEKSSISHACNLWWSFQNFYLSITADAPLDTFGIEDLLNYRSRLTPAVVWKLGALRVLLERANSIGHKILTPQAGSYLIDAIIPGNPKGVDVRTRDPRKGAFTSVELEGLNYSLNNEFMDGKVSLTDYALCHLIMAYGMRPKQIAAMKAGDLLVAKAADGNKVFTLRIPRAKQRGELVRETFKNRPCDRRLGELLERQIQEDADRRAFAPGIPHGERPLFSSKQEGLIPGFEHHRTAQEITAQIAYTFERISKIHVSSIRFRHTLAKRAHDDGADIYIIAELLDHSDIQNAKIYTEGGPDIVDRLNRTMAMDLAPLAQAFSGLLISRTDIEAESGGRAKRIHDRALPEGKGSDPLGNCGLYGFCDLTRPVACYTCRNFRPWDDGPHEAVLSVLLASRDEQVSQGRSPRIYGLHDRTITAVARVVQLCEERKSVLEMLPV